MGKKLIINKIRKTGVRFFTTPVLLKYFIFSYLPITDIYCSSGPLLP